MIRLPTANLNLTFIMHVHIYNQNLSAAVVNPVSLYSLRFSALMFSVFCQLGFFVPPNVTFFQYIVLLVSCLMRAI